MAAFHLFTFTYEIDRFRFGAVSFASVFIQIGSLRRFSLSPKRYGFSWSSPPPFYRFHGRIFRGRRGTILRRKFAPFLVKLWAILGYFSHKLAQTGRNHLQKRILKGKNPILLRILHLSPKRDFLFIMGIFQNSLFWSKLSPKWRFYDCIEQQTVIVRFSARSGLQK